MMMNYIKRRFSSGDLQGELKDQQEYDLKMNAQGQQSSIVNPIAQVAQTILPKKVQSPSAPSSPTKNISSMFNAARGIINQTINQTTQPQPQQQQQPQHSLNSQRQSHRDKSKILLVIDNDITDWSKYFRGRRLPSDFDLRVEQAEFKDLNLTSYSETNGCIVSIDIVRNGTKLVRSFKPDFVLIRQHVRDVNSNWKNLVIGLEFAGVQSVNSLRSIYNFADRPWVLAGLTSIQRKLGVDVFPLISQVYYPNYKEMLTSNTFPCVVKIGHAHQGVGKIKIHNNADFQDVTSLVAMSQTYCTLEAFIDAKCDIHLQKIGNNLKAFTRKSISGNWKANTGTSMLEEIQINERYKLWINEVSKMYGDLDICSIEIVVGQDSKEYIIDVNYSSMNLIGKSQEDDRRLIADLVFEKISLDCHVKSNDTKSPKQSQEVMVPQLPSANSNQSLISSQTSASTQLSNGPPRQLPTQPPAIPSRTPQQNQVTSTITSIDDVKVANTSQQQQPLKRPQSNQVPSQPPIRPPTRPQMLPQQVVRPNTSNSNVQKPTGNNDDSEDTMKNLRKTFAGIFGDM